MSERIWLSAPDVGPRERELLLDAFDSNWIAPLGPHVDGLEMELAAVADRAACAAVSSGTAGLQLALLAMGVEAGDVVVTATQTFAATANAIVHAGGVPVFVDSEPDRWSMDPALLDRALGELAAQGRRVAAVVPVDLYGQCADHDAIAAVAAAHGVPVLADAAESLGAQERGRPAGSHGMAAVFSFNGNKIITGSGGGAVVTDDEELAARVRFLATQARDPAPHYQHSVVGFNERMSNLIAAVVRGQLEHLDAKVARRRLIHQRYRDGLADVGPVSFPATPVGSEPNRWLTCVLLSGGAAQRDAVLAGLGAQDIEARPTWKPMHQQPVYAGATAFGGSVSEDVFERGVCLPSGTGMSDDDQARVLDVLRAVVR